MKIVDEETFGPVIAVVRVDNADEAVKLANESRYGLNGSVWTKDISKGQRLARKLEVGIALVNNHSLTELCLNTLDRDKKPGQVSRQSPFLRYIRQASNPLHRRFEEARPMVASVEPELAEMGAALVKRNQGSLGALLKLAGLVNKRIAAIQKFNSNFVHLACSVEQWTTELDFSLFICTVVFVHNQIIPSTRTRLEDRTRCFECRSAVEVAKISRNFCEELVRPPTLPRSRSIPEAI